MAGTLQKLMDARLTQRVPLNKGQSDALKVIILADSRSNALLVGGGRDGFEMVEALAKQLDTAGAALSGRIRLIPLQFADRLNPRMPFSLYVQAIKRGAISSAG